jgi:hypothetical protein
MHILPARSASCTSHCSPVSLAPRRPFLYPVGGPREAPKAPTPACIDPKSPQVDQVTIPRSLRQPRPAHAPAAHAAPRPTLGLSAPHKHMRACTRKRSWRYQGNRLAACSPVPPPTHRHRPTDPPTPRPTGCASPGQPPPRSPRSPGSPRLTGSPRAPHGLLTQERCKGTPPRRLQPSASLPAGPKRLANAPPATINGRRHGRRAPPHRCQTRCAPIRAPIRPHVPLPASWAVKHTHPGHAPRQAAHPAAPEAGGHAAPPGRLTVPPLIPRPSPPGPAPPRQAAASRPAAPPSRS